LMHFLFMYELSVGSAMDQMQCVICGQGSLLCGGRSNRRL
jgi:hypothetical protein